MLKDKKSVLNFLELSCQVYNYRPQTSVCQEFCPQEGGVHPQADTTPQADNLWADPMGRHPPGQTPPWADTPQADTLPSDGHCSGRYASYWNAFLFFFVCS